MFVNHEFTHLQGWHQILSIIAGYSSKKALRVALKSVTFIQVWVAVLWADFISQSSLKLFGPQEMSGK